jgi:hypothetical protein
VPTSVLLAVLAAAGLLALAPALVRRHDVTERQVAERAQSTARVLRRRHRRRSVPGTRPVNPSKVLVATLRTAAPVSPAAPAADDPELADGRRSATSTRERRASALGIAPRSAPPARRSGGQASRRDGSRRGGSGRGGSGRGGSGRGGSPAIHRRRRVLTALVLLNLVKLAGVATVGPGFWVGFAVTFTLLVVFVVHLRNLALADQRQRRLEARRAAELAAQQAEVRREQERRAAARREVARRMAEQRESLRRAAASGAVQPSMSYRAPYQRRSRAG